MKNFLIAFLFILITGCGFNPIYSEKNLDKFDISIENLGINGDRTASIFFKNKLNKYSSKETKNSINLNLNSKVNRNIKTKDSKGNASSYELILNVSATASNNEGNIFEIFYQEEFEYETITNKAQLKEYEKTIIQNLAENILNKIIMDIENRIWS